MAIRIDAIGVVATDFATTLAFYERLGCTFDPEAAEPHAEADLGGVRLMIDSLASITELGLVGDGIGPRNGIALAAQLDSPAAVDAVYAELDAEGRGLHKPFDAPFGMRYATLTDPDGTKVDLYAWLPGQGPPA